MLTKAELIEKLKKSKIDISSDDYFNEMLDFDNTIELAEQLPDTTELQAENEVLKLALRNCSQIMRDFLDKLGYTTFGIGGKTFWACVKDKLNNENDNKFVCEYFIDQARQQINEGKK